VFTLSGSGAASKIAQSLATFGLPFRPPPRLAQNEKLECARCIASSCAPSRLQFQPRQKKSPAGTGLSVSVRCGPFDDELMPYDGLSSGLGLGSGCSLTPSPPAEKATARQDQARQASTGDGAGDILNAAGKTDGKGRDSETSHSSAEGKIPCRIDLSQCREGTKIIIKFAPRTLNNCAWAKGRVNLHVIGDGQGVGVSEGAKTAGKWRLNLSCPLGLGSPLNTALPHH
jgi:hypothetical protein